MHRTLLTVGRLAAAVCCATFLCLGVYLSKADVTATFSAADTRGLTSDLEVRCTLSEDVLGAPSLDVPDYILVTKGVDAYDEWVRLQVKEQGTAFDGTADAQRMVCQEERVERITTLIWVVAGALAAALTFVASYAVGRRRLPDGASG